MSGAKENAMVERDLIRNKTNESLVGINRAGLSTDAKAMFESIARRAYQSFEAQGRKHGHDLEHWLQAEAELFDKPPVELAESQEEVTVLAEVSGYAPGELEVDLEPRLVTIIGKHQTGADKNSVTEQSTRELLRHLELPVEIDTHQATALLKGGILELDMKKAIAAKHSKGQAASAGSST
jgi:HSP20 family molecular chaperone IbpA